MHVTIVISSYLYCGAFEEMKKGGKGQTQADLFLLMRFCCFILYVLESKIPNSIIFLEEIKKMKDIVFSFVTIWHLKIVKAGST